jgi:hypothetical protein
MAITPNNVSLDGDGGGILLTSDSTATWTTDIGTLYTDAGLTSEYDGVTNRTTIYLRPFNRTNEGEVRAGGSTAYISVLGVLPEGAYYPMEWDGDRVGIVSSVSRSGRPRGRIISDAEYLRDYKLIFNNSRAAAIEDFEDFYSYHYPHKTFKFRNLWMGIDGVFRFASKFKGKAERRAGGSFDVAIAQVPYDAGIEFAADTLYDGINTAVWGAYSTSKMYRRYSGSALRIKDAADFEKDIGFDQNGNLAVNELTASAPFRVVKWYDQSGNGRDLTVAATNIPTVNSANLAIDFVDQYFILPDMSGLSGAEALIKKKHDAGWALTGSGGLWTMGTSGSPTAAPWTDSVLYDDFGSTVRKIDSGAMTAPEVTALESWHVYSAYSFAGDWASYISGAQMYTTATNTVAFPSAGKLGHSSNGYYIDGLVESFVIYSAKLTTAERLRLHAGM